MSHLYPFDPVIDFQGSQLIHGGGEIPTARRTGPTTTVGLTNQGMRFTFFTARRTEPIARVRTWVSAQAQVGATLARIGIYTVDELDNLSALVASTANDTSLWSTINTHATKALSATWDKERGTRYAIGALIDGTSQAPNIMGGAVGGSAVWAPVPRETALSTQTSLPASILVGSLGPTAVVPYFELLP